MSFNSWFWVMGRFGGRSRSGRKNLPTGRVVFRNQVPPAQAVHYLRASDVSFVPLAADPVLEKFVPSKLYDFAQWVDQLWLFQTARPAR